MVVGLNDKVIFIHPLIIAMDIKEIDLDHEKSTDYIFYRFYRANHPNDIGFLAVEGKRLRDFQALIKQVGGDKSIFELEDDEVMQFELTVNKEFKYGEDPRQTFRFLVFQDPSNNPHQDKIALAFASTEASNSLNERMKEIGNDSATLSIYGDISNVLQSFRNTELLSF